MVMFLINVPSLPKCHEQQTGIVYGELEVFPDSDINSVEYGKSTS